MNADQPIKVHILDPDSPDPDEQALADVGVVSSNGQRTLFLRPQSFSSAVRQIRRAMPDLPLEQVERLVREHAQFRDMDELLAPVPAVSVPPVDLPPQSPAPPVPAVAARRGRGRNWVIAAVLLPAFAGTWGLGHATGSKGNQTHVEAAAKVHDQRQVPEPFQAGAFLGFSNSGKIECRTIDALEAECTDSDGMVMATTAATGAESTVFIFSYGSERVGLRIFHDSGYAATWFKQDGSQAMYPNMQRWGRYVLWGTDQERIANYLRELESAPEWPSALDGAGGAGAPLPPRLAALTLGALGLGPEDVDDIVLRPGQSGVATPTLLAARAVLGIGETGLSGGASDGSDIVALAAGIELYPSVAETELHVSKPSAGVLLPKPKPKPVPEVPPVTVPLRTQVLPLVPPSSPRPSVPRPSSEEVGPPPVPDPIPVPSPEPTPERERPSPESDPELSLPEAVEPTPLPGEGLGEENDQHGGHVADVIDHGEGADEET
ncbi:hypothetical protein [Streptomyces sp. NPDC091278]|uniref:hypothetical protein n=1 Tax=Streptomyces sp. NPDC091278 TaxID=3155301 RepID=UPI00344CB2D2